MHYIFEVKSFKLKVVFIPVIVQFLHSEPECDKCLTFTITLIDAGGKLSNDLSILARNHYLNDEFSLKRKISKFNFSKRGKKGQLKLWVLTNNLFSITKSEKLMWNTVELFSSVPFNKI